jgi:hypothetical protein
MDNHKAENGENTIPNENADENANENTEEMTEEMTETAIEGSYIADDIDPDIQESTNAIEDAITETMRMAFWDKMEDDIKNKDYDTVIAVLEEIRDGICELVPSRNDLHETMYEAIDIDLIKQMIQHDAIDNSYIYNLVQFIITKLKNFDSLEDEPFYEIWREQVNRRLTDNETPLYIILPRILREAFHRIAKIDYSIRQFKASELYQVIRERRRSIHGDID